MKTFTFYSLTFSCISKNTPILRAFFLPLIAFFILVSSPTFAQPTIIGTSHPNLWVDANKCGTTGPVGSFLSFYILNNTGSAITDVTATFSGFTGANPSAFTHTEDSIRTFSTINNQDSAGIFYYVDYHTICDSSTLIGWSANYTITLTYAEDGGTPVVYNGSFSTDELLTASAAGLVQSSTLDDGFFVGQVLTQTVVYSWGNNTDHFVQPVRGIYPTIGDFNSEAIRLIDSEVLSVSGGTGFIGKKYRLWFPGGNTAGTGVLMTVKYTWLILATNTAQTTAPWAAAKSGTPYKYNDETVITTIFPNSEQGITISKSVSPDFFGKQTSNPNPPNYGAGVARWTVTFTNISSPAVDLYLDTIHDVIPSCMTISNATVTGSGVTTSNSFSVPSIGSTGNVSWVAQKVPDYNNDNYKVPAGGTLTLIYETTNQTCAEPSTQVNFATADIRSTSIGPAKDSIRIGCDTDYGTLPSDQEIICSGGDPSEITFTTLPTSFLGNFTYQWYYQDGQITCPAPGSGTGSWTLISGATGTSYDPPSGLTTDRTYAVLVTPDAQCEDPSDWASGCRQVIINTISPGSIASDQTICEGEDPAAFTSTTSGTGLGTITYQWQSSTNGTDFFDINGATGETYDSGPLTQDTWFRRFATSTYLGVPCSDVSNTVKVTVNPLPTVTCPVNFNECCSSPAFNLDTLQGVSPAGGTFKLNNVVVTTFDPDCGSIGDFDIWYIYSDGATGCTDSCMFTISVLLAPDVDDLADVTECDSYTLPTITGTNLTGNEAYYTGTGGTGTQYLAGHIITSTITLYIYDETGSTPNCFDEEMVTITIYDSPDIDNPGPQTECDSYALPTITGTNLNNPQYYDDSQANNGQPFAGPVTSAMSPMTVWIYDENPNDPTCNDEESFVVTVYDSPDVDDLPDVTICDGYTLPTITGTNLTGGEAYYTGSGGTGTSYAAGDVITATITLYIYDETGTTPNCFDEEMVTITIIPSPDVDDLADVSACDSYALPAITGTNLTGGEAYWTATGGTGTMYIAGDVITATITLYIYDETGTTPNCFDEEMVTITIVPSPDVDDLPDVTICDGYTLPTITGTNLTGDEAYYTGSGGTGTQYLAGEEITSDVTLYIYDHTGTDPDCFDEESFSINIVVPAIQTYLYLEGSAIDAGGTANYTFPMRTDLNDLRVLPGQAYEDFFVGVNYTPPGQPYNVAPWNYNGTEGDGFDSGGNPANGDAGYPPTVVDWVLVSLRETTEDSTTVCQAAALLHNDGTVEFVEDFDCLCSLDLNGSYYLVVEHLHHLIIMSPSPVPMVDGILTYDFRGTQSYIDDPFGFGYVGQKEATSGNYVMYGGNGNQEPLDVTDITSNDEATWGSQNGTIGQYRLGDYNMNGDVNYNDRNLWLFNNGLTTSVPR